MWLSISKAIGLRSSPSTHNCSMLSFKLFCTGKEKDRFRKDKSAYLGCFILSSSSGTLTMQHAPVSGWQDSREKLFFSRKYKGMGGDKMEEKVKGIFQRDQNQIGLWGDLRISFIFQNYWYTLAYIHCLKNTCPICYGLLLCQEGNSTWSLVTLLSHMQQSSSIVWIILNYKPWWDLLLFSHSFFQQSVI